MHVILAAPLLASLFAFGMLTPTHSESWTPVLEPPPTVLRLFDLPHGEYRAGHRGVDLQAKQGDTVFAPTSAEVVFINTVVNRGVVTLRLENGSLLSFEPVLSSTTVGLQVGEAVSAGDEIGVVSGATHCGSRCLHVGLRQHDQYQNPVGLLLGGIKPQLLPLKRGATD